MTTRSTSSSIPGGRQRDDEVFVGMLEDEHANAFMQRVDEIVSKRFMPQDRGTTLQLGCSTPELTVNLLRKITGTARLVVVDSRVPLIDAVRFKTGRAGPGKIFFKSDLDWERLKFDDEVFNCVVSSLFWDEAPNRADMLADISRVILPGGSVLLTLYMEGSFRQLWDLYADTLTKFDLLHFSGALNQTLAGQPDEDQARAMLEMSGFSLCRTSAEEITLEFESSRELFSSPLVKALWLHRWNAPAGEESERILWHVREAMDRYFSDRPVRLSVRVGFVTGIK